MKTDAVYGNHIGIVINQDDPEYRGRVQIFIPYLTNTVYKGWNESLKNKKFKNIGGGGDLTPELVEELRKVLPWAECAAPIFGGGTSATHNPVTGRTSTNPYKVSGPANPAQALKDPSQQGLMAEAERLRNLGNRNFNFGDYTAPGVFTGLDGNEYPGGRCLTAVGCIAGAGAQSPELAQPTGTGGIPEAQAIASGQNNFFQKSGMYKDGKPPSMGYSPKKGDIIAMQGGPSRQGHIIICTGFDANNKPIFMSDDVSENYTDYLPGGRKNGYGPGQYNGVVVLEPTPEGSSRWAKTMGDSESGELGTPNSPNAATAAEYAATVVNPFDQATESTMEVKSVAREEEDPDVNGDGVVSVDELGLGEDGAVAGTTEGRKITAPVTNYSLGTNVGGPDELNDGNEANSKNPSKWPGTNQGYSATGQNLTPGAVAVNTKAYPLGTVFRDDNGYAYIAVDKHGNKDPNVLDLYQTPDNYKNSPTGPRNFTIVGQVDKIGKSPEELKAQLAQYGKVPEGGSAKDWLVGNGAGTDDKTQGYASVSPADTAASLSSPYPNYTAGNVSAYHHGAQASGMLSIPQPGAKVFVFFLAGDIQKPVYFANALEPETVRKMTQSASPYLTDHSDTQRRRKSSGLWNGDAGISLTDEKGYVPGTNIPEDNTVIQVGADGTGWRLAPGAANLNAGGNLTYDVRGDEHKSIAGTKSSRSGPAFSSIDGDNVTKVGSFDKKQMEAAENLKKLLSEVQTEKVESIKNNAKDGEKVPCPICSIKYPVDKASAVAKRLFNFVRIVTPPWFSYGIDVLEFLTGLLMVPFISIMPGSALNDGTCGNTDCENGQVPSPQKPIKEANREATEKLKSKQEEISKLEQQLGNGGTHSVVASKDIVISAGIVLDDQPVYAPVGNKSIANRLEKGKTAPGVLVKGSCKEVKNVLHTEPIQLPFGNILLRGGSKIKIIAGSPGIDINSKGKISIGGGTVEILSGDGDLILGSPTHTILKGKAITIDADDRSGGGGLEINSGQTIVKGLSVTGNMACNGALNVNGELSVRYLNTVGERYQTGPGSPPDQRVPFANWAVGACQTNDIMNTIRTALTHFIFPGALLQITNIIKLVMQTYNTIYTNTIIEPTTTGMAVGYIYSTVFNWHHNQTNEPEDHHHDATRPQGTYTDHPSGVDQQAVDADPVPTPRRKTGTGLPGGPKTLAGCGGFGGWGGGSGGRSSKYGKLNSFGIGDQVSGFNGTRLQNNNIKFEYNKDGTIKPIVQDVTGKC
jgi:hypothetical protein